MDTPDRSKDLEALNLTLKSYIGKLRHPIREYTKKSIDRRLRAVRKYLDQNDREAAIEILEEIIRKYKNYAMPSLYVKLSECYGMQKAYDKQVALLSEAAERYPQSIGVYAELVSAQINNGDYKESVQTWNSISDSFNPISKIQLWPRFSRQYLASGEPGLSESILKNGLSSLPTQINLTIELASIYMYRQKYSLVLEILEPILRKSRKNQSINPSLLLKARYLNSVAARMLKTGPYEKKLRDYKKSAKAGQNKIAVFTCSTGGYDPVQPHEVIDNNIDYILFTDQAAQTLPIHQTRYIPFHHKDPVRTARYVKTHPHVLLPEYDIAIWVDANVMITGDLQKYIDKMIKSHKPVGSIPHPNRASIYEEAEACIKLGKDDVSVIKSQIEDYRRRGYKGKDMIESGFIIYNLKHPRLNTFLDMWWEQIDTYSRRDQLSFGIALSNSDTKWHPVMKSPQNIRNSQDFILVPHSKDEQFGDVLIKKVGNTSLSAPVPAYRSIETATTINTVDIIVCVHNALSDVKKCLESIVKNSPKRNTNLIIIDDGSRPHTAAFLKKFASTNNRVALYRNEVAGGYTKAANLGVSKSTADFIILVNSDTVVTKNWIKKLSHSVQLYPNTGIVGPLSSAASHQSIPNHESSRNQTAVNNLPKGLTPDDMNALCEKWSKNIAFPLVPLVHGFCFGITRQLIDAIGGFDEKSFPNGYGEENDYCFRAANAGFNMIVSIDTYIFHSKSKSYSDDERRINLMKTGAQKLADLHGKERITRAILSMDSNPSLKQMRSEAEILY